MEERTASEGGPYRPHYDDASWERWWRWWCYFRWRIRAADLAAFLISSRGRDSEAEPLRVSERMSALAEITQRRLLRA